MPLAPLSILYITSCPPHSRAFGGQLRALHIGRALKKLGDVTVAVVRHGAIDEESMRATAVEFHIEQPVGVEIARSKSLGQRLRRAFDTKFLNVHGCLANSSDRNRLLGRLNDFDLVWILNSRTPNILNHWRWSRSVLDVDDLPSTYERTVWQNGASAKQKLKAGLQMVLLKRRELRLKERFSALAVCSEADHQYLGGGDRVHVIPNGFERPARPPFRNPVHPPRIGFIGLYSYAPNMEGVKWFIQECWPLVKQQIPEARLRLVGKDTDGPLKPRALDVDALGWVADPADEIATWSAMIVPVCFGAGTRVKIADAFSRKCPVVATSLGAFGYDVENGRQLRLADHPREFAQACIDLVRHPLEAAQMADRAWNEYLQKWTWDAIAPRVWAAAEDALRRSNPQPSAARDYLLNK